MPLTNLLAVRAQVDAAAERAGRDPDEVTLIAVTKTVPIDLIRAAYDAGQRHFGESRLQEALPKLEALPHDCIWHFIGKLQSNKARRAAETFSVIHTLEKDSQLHEISKAANIVEGLIEINSGEEAQKSGILASALDEFRKSVLQCRQVHLRGLMTVGPAHQNPEEMRPYFQHLRRLRDEAIPGGWLSMGMSSDYEVAIQEGATHVRIGSAIFGPRQG